MNIPANETTSFQFLKLEPAEHLQFLCLREDTLLDVCYLRSTAMSTLAFDPQKEIRLNAQSSTNEKSRISIEYRHPDSWILNLIHFAVFLSKWICWQSFLLTLAYSSWAHRVSTRTQVLWETLMYCSSFRIIPNKEMFMSALFCMTLLSVVSIDRYQNKA